MSVSNRFRDSVLESRSSPQAVGINRLMMLLIVVLLVWIFFERGGMPGQGRNPKWEDRPVTPRGDLAEDEKATIEIFRRASPSVVYIRNIAVRQDIFTRDIFKIPQGAGSGFIYDSAGYIVTNFHVIRGADALLVTLADQTELPATFVGGAPDKDIAVLKVDGIPPERLKPLMLGTSADLQVGQKVFAIGNPFGLDHTLTTGIVSALGREIQSLVDGRMIEDVIQTDAAINPGNSGGPLLDSAGRLIGINTQIASPTGASAGIGFAVPVDIVTRVVPQIIRYGKVIRPGLGVTIVPDDLTRQLGLRGVMIREVQPGSEAERAGLRGVRLSRDGRRLQEPGDLIIAIGSRSVSNSNDLLNALEQYQVGDVVEVTLRRGNEERKTKIRLQAIS